MVLFSWRDFGRKKRCNVAITNVYYPCDLVKKRRVWEDLTLKKSQSNAELWCVAGDFNCVKGKWTKIRGWRIWWNGWKKRIQSIYGRLGSGGYSYVGEKIYMVRRPNGKAMSWIDRIFVNREWINKWSGCSQHVLKRNILDHCSIVLKNAKVDWEPKPFKVLECWFEDKKKW